MRCPWSRHLLFSVLVITLDSLWVGSYRKGQTRELFNEEINEKVSAEASAGSFQELKAVLLEQTLAHPSPHTLTPPRLGATVGSAVKGPGVNRAEWISRPLL